LELLLSPQLTVLSIGAFALGLSLLCALFFSDAALFRLPRMNVIALTVIALVAAAIGLVTIVYTGVLLQRYVAVLFWNTPALPIVFGLSSLSCGVGCVFVGAAFADVRETFLPTLMRLARVDTVLLILEAVVLALYLGWGMTGTGTAAAASALLMGNLAWLFWGGVVVCGILVPLVMEHAVLAYNYRSQLLWVAVLLWAGSLALRFCVAGAGAYDVTQMPALLYGISL
jgi:formate-dependent nitrite reductase membrane component NrfD